MDEPTGNLERWSTDELFAEVLSRSAGDRSALDRIQVTTMRALLDNCDQKGTRPDHWHAEEAPVA